MRFEFALLVFMLSCGGSTPPPAGDDKSWMEKDDEAAAPSCGEDCVSGAYGNAEIVRTVYEVSRCWKFPVYVEADLSGVVSVEFKHVTCAEAIRAVAQAADMHVMAVEGRTTSGQTLAGGAIAVVRSPKPKRLIDVAELEARGSSRSGGELIGGGWSRETDDEDDDVDRRGNREPDKRGRESDENTESGTMARQRAARQRVCRSKCSGPYSSCRAGCANSAAPESCYARCDQQRETCARPCDSL